MFDDRESNTVLIVGLVVSAVLHLLVLMITAGDGWRLLNRDGKLTARPFEEVMAVDELEVLAGIDAETPATITWIGYESYVEHMAPSSEVEQAALESGGEEMTPPGGEPRPETARLEQMREAMADAAARMTQAQERLSAVAEATWREMLASAPDATIADARDAAEESERDAIEEVDPSDEPPTETVAEGESAEAEETAPPASTDPQPEGAPADRDADATSTEPEIIEVRVGKPVAREGLEIRTKRPSLSALRSWSAASRRPPLMRIHFLRDGTVKLVTVLQSSGSVALDEDLTDSLYGWRASGEQLEALGEQETIPFTVRLLPP
jgi:hypothetical protein